MRLQEGRLIKSSADALNLLQNGKLAGMLERKLFLTEARVIRSSTDAYNLLQSGKLAGRLGGKKFVPSWLLEDPELFKDLVDVTLSVIGDDPNIGGDEVIQFLIKASKIGPEKWQDMLEYAKDTIIELSKAFSTQWFAKSSEIQAVLQTIIDAPDFNSVKEEVHELEKDIQDTFAKRAAKKGKKLTASGNENNLYTTLYDDGTWKLFVPKCFEGDIALASHIKTFRYSGKDYNKTRWCTAAGEDFWKNYSKNGNKYYVIQYWQDGVYTDAWQLAFDKPGHVEFMDKADKPEYAKMLKAAPKEMLSLIICDARGSTFYGVDLYELAQVSKKVTGSFSNLNYLLKKQVKELPDLVKNSLFENIDGFYVNKAKELVDYKDYENVEVLVLPDEIAGVFELPLGIKQTVKRIVLPANLKGIPENFAKDCKNLESVVINESCNSIGNSAFKNCSNLNEIKIPANVTVVEESAFEGTGLVSAIFDPNSRVTKIPVDCFSDCSSLVELVLPKGLTSLGSSAFENCEELTFVDLPETLQTIGLSAFSETGITDLHIPDSVMSIGSCAFDSCEKLEFVHLPANLQKAGSRIFSYCENLKQVENMHTVNGAKKVFEGCDSLDTSEIA